MRKRYRVYVCPADGCPAMGKKGGFCPTHGDDFTPVIVRVEDAQDNSIRIKDTADRLAQAGTKVGESAGKATDPFGVGAIFQGLADEYTGKKARPPRDYDIDADADDDEEEQDDDL